jgi:dTDP-4-amino-4,6-dideoxygalactose transaminase
MESIPLIKPFIPEDALSRIGDVLESGYLTEGPVTKEFESLCKDYIGVKHAYAVCNCTVGLEAALRAVDVGPGDEVIVPDYTYPATASVVHLVGATPVLVDVDPRSMLIDLEKASAALTPRTKAIMPVSLFGNPLDYDQLKKFKEKHDLIVIEDAACSIGAKYKETMVGAWADISVFSMHPRKFITTGEGGLVTTNNPEYAAFIDAYKHFGIQKSAEREPMVFGMMGTNYKLCNIQAALGVAQMHLIDDLLQRRVDLAHRYDEMLGSIEGIEIPKVVEGGRHSYQTYSVSVDKRDLIMKSMREQGIEVQIGTYSLHMHPAFQTESHCMIRGNLTGSITACNKALALPLFHDMTELQQIRVCQTLISLL